MIIDREARNRMIVVGSVIQANENAPKELKGLLGTVKDKGPYGVTAQIQGDTDCILRWEQVDYVGQAEKYDG